MRAVVTTGDGGPEVLSVGEVDDPRPGAGEVLVDVVATAVNRADTLQRMGFYPPPPGAPETIGLECSGRIAELGEGVEGWSVGDEVCALLAGTAQAPVAKAVATATSQDLSPTERQRRVSKLVSNVIERSHYRQSPINDPVSSLVLDRFLEQLDGSRSYFLASDIAEFERFRYQLDDAVVGGQLEPVFAIFNRFQVRNKERVAYALKLLETQPDFTVDEAFEFDRTKAPWAKTSAELNDIWRRRVKNDAVSLMLTEKTWDETRDILQKRYERVVKRTEQVTSDDIFEVFMNSFAHVFDPHSSYFSPRNSEEYRIQMSLSYEGIGASLQLVDDYVTVLNVLPGGPAAVAGTLGANDRIIAVGEGKSGKMVDVIGWRLDDVVQIIRGKVGTTVRLNILPAGAAPGTERGDGRTRA